MLWDAEVADDDSWHLLEPCPNAEATQQLVVIMVVNYIGVLKKPQMVCNNISPPAVDNCADATSCTAQSESRLNSSVLALLSAEALKQCCWQWLVCANCHNSAVVLKHSLVNAATASTACSKSCKVARTVWANCPPMLRTDML